MLTRKWLTGWLALSLVAALALLGAPAAPGASAAPAAQSGNLITNPGFEDAGTAATATGWLPWWLESAKPSDGSFNYAFRPSWNVEKLSSGAAAEFIRSGNNSQRVVNNWDPWYAGLKQTVSAPAGARVRLTAYARVWTASNFYPAASETAVAVKVQAGLDPNGSDNQFASGVVWSIAGGSHTGWQALSVETVVGSGGRVGVFLGADYRGYSRLFMTAFFDDVTLEVISVGGTALPTSTPTLTPTRTTTPGPSATVTTTPVPPTPTGAPEFYVVKAGDTLGAIARRFGIPLSALLNANNIKNADRIYVGQVLIIRGGAAGTTPSAAQVIHVVQRGDTLNRLARRYNTTVAQIKAWNTLKTDIIYIGQRLVVGP